MGVKYICQIYIYPNITVVTNNEKDYICITDMTKPFDGGSGLIENWLRNKNTVEFLGVWERLNNPNFNSVEFDGIMMQVGLNRFKLSAKKWVNKIEEKKES